jgi:glyoxylase-like metal-dependent hydrolase (beta-lactamase superfamily II)
MRRTFLLSFFAVLAFAALFVSRSDATPETTQQIAPGIWFREGDLQNLGHCNNIIIEMKDYLIVVDANFPSGARAALADAKKVSTKPVKYVFDTHHHGDHAYGNSIWTEAGAITLAYKGVAEEMKRTEPAAWEGAAKQRQDVRELNRSGPEPPKQTFDKPKFVLKDDSRTVEFHFFGWAHTRGDGFVYLPKEQIVCTGDAAVNGPHNYTGDANIGNWPNVIRKVQKLKVKTVLPGHGLPGGPEVLEGQAQYMIALHKAVKTAVARGTKLDDLQTVEVPENVRKWAGASQKAQIKDAYEEISQGKPHGEIKNGK